MPTREEQEALAFLRELAADCDRRVASATTAIRRYSRQPTFTPLDSKNLGDIEFDQQAAKEVGARYKNIIALIEAAELRKGDWQDIATAPKDGTQVLLLSGGRIGNGCWNPGGAFFGAHWMTTGDIFGPSHWMPLPAPPVNAEAVK
jgi:hypothetical protein